jgi:hypothetical protein
LSNSPGEFPALVDLIPGPDPEVRRRLATQLETLMEAEKSRSRRSGRSRHGPWRHRLVVVAVSAVILVVFFAPLPHVSLFDRLNGAPSVGSTTLPSISSTTSGAPTSTTQPISSDGVVKVAHLPAGLQFASAPVLTDDGHDVVAVIATYSGGPPLRLARFELPGGRFTLGPVIDGMTAGLFTGPGGRVYLLNLSGRRFGHFQLWRIRTDLTPVLLARLPFTERTAVEGSDADPAIAVAVVPGKDEAWIGDGTHIELVSLADGALIATRPAPRGTLDNVMGLAMARPGGPLYALFCDRRSPNVDCGAIAEINPANGSVISLRLFNGEPYGVVATPEGVWLSSGGGGNGTWMDFLSSRDLRVTRLFGAIGGNDSLATGDVVWSANGTGPPGPVNCFRASASGSIRRNTVVGWRTRLLFPPVHHPFGIAPQLDSLLVTAGVTIVAVPIPKACAASR